LIYVILLWIKESHNGIKSGIKNKCLQTKYGKIGKNQFRVIPSPVILANKPFSPKSNTNWSIDYALKFDQKINPDLSLERKKFFPLGIGPLDLS